MQHPELLPVPPRYPVVKEAQYILSSMSLQTAINFAGTRARNYREQKAMVNHSFYMEVHSYLESLSINN